MIVEAAVIAFPVITLSCLGVWLWRDRGRAIEDNSWENMKKAVSRADIPDAYYRSPARVFLPMIAFLVVSVALSVVLIIVRK